MAKKGKTGMTKNEFGTVGGGPAEARRRRAEARAVKHGVKTQGRCSGHERCLKGQCEHPNSLGARARGAR